MIELPAITDVTRPITHWRWHWQIEQPKDVISRRLRRFATLPGGATMDTYRRINRYWNATMYPALPAMARRWTRQDNRLFREYLRERRGY